MFFIFRHSVAQLLELNSTETMCLVKGVEQWVLVPNLKSKNIGFVSFDIVPVEIRVGFGFSLLNRTALKFTLLRHLLQLSTNV